ncbi:gliding motility protein GldB-related protein [Spirosoma validum]|uniref:DUF2268 domain-containing protein n=1 Tax=Spirosoma validum TaxID=2771355 RepID=A0A927AYN0_9BACT|nr:DUF2268 domain-containing putative Zn-dependent protease [Spirosoma validum]MBD2752176.1 hypothetical protein [Spirosoma validum]
MRVLFTLLVLTAQLATAQKSTGFHSDLDSVQIITSDIDHYLKAYKMTQKEPAQRNQIYQREYIDQASIGLKDYYQRRIQSVEAFVKNQDEKPKFYAAIVPALEQVSQQKPAIRKGLQKLKELYPQAAFPNVYLVVGRWNSGGTVSDNGLLLSADMLSKSAVVPTDELVDWQRLAYKPASYLPDVVVHELIHTLQARPSGERTLLKMAIREGMADFLTELATGKNPSDHIYQWAKPQERVLWQEFKQDMNEAEPKGWLQELPKRSDRIADLGYYEGYEIVKAYYEQATDKKQAIQDMLTMADYGMLFTQSGYEKKMAMAR